MLYDGRRIGMKRRRTDGAPGVFSTQDVGQREFSDRVRAALPWPCATPAPMYRMEDARRPVETPMRTPLSNLTLAALASLAATAAAAEATPRLLARDGTSPYVILLPDDPHPAERTAAVELQSFLKQVTGAELPVLSEAQAPQGKPIIGVGPCRAAARLAPGLDIAAMAADAIVLKTAGADLLLAGPRPRGTLYAVYSFLEDVVGCRWWTSTEQTIPSRPTLPIPDLDTTYAPALISREAFYHDAFEGVFAPRLKLNGHFARIPPGRGGHMSIVGWCHTFFQILPPDRYFAAHPEWYSEIGGKRSADGTQLCLTNPEMRAEFVRAAKEWIRKEPGAGLISVSQNDWGGKCECANCRTLEQQEGAASGPLLQFVNAVAEEIEKDDPGLLVETLAYSYTRQPPKGVRPRRNVVIRLCSIECSYVQPLETGEQNVTFRHDIEAWSAIAPKLYVWDYVTNFANYLLPHPNLRVLAPNIRTFVKHHAVGLFEQGDAGSTVGDFVRLRAWLIAHLLWDPSRDDSALIDEFLKGYYGAAAPYLRQYLDLRQDVAAASGAYLRCYMQDTSAWFSQEALDKATALYDQATQAVAADPVLSERVRRERLPLDLVWIQRYHASARSWKATNVVQIPWAQSPQAAVDEFVALALKHQVGQYAEGRAFEPWAQGLQLRVAKPSPPPDACKDLPRDRWVDYQDHLFTLHNPGAWVEAVKDPAASDGFAARMPGNHTQWATQLPLPDDLAEGNPWRVCIVMRCETAAADGLAAEVGIYDNQTQAGLAGRRLQVADIAGPQYRTIELGPVNVSGQVYAWVAPCNRAEITGIYVDRIFLVRDAPKP